MVLLIRLDVVVTVVDGVKLNQWLSTLLQTQGSDIFRMKGIPNIAGEDFQFVFQGVHMLFDGRPDRLWKADEPCKNQLSLSDAIWIQLSYKRIFARVWSSPTPLFFIP